MSTPIPENVADLLAPIPGASPTGKEDLSTVEAYVKLEQMLSKNAPTPEDYNNSVNWAMQVLKNDSKNVRVATWLGFMWYRTDKLAGLRNGLLLTTALLERFSDKLFPSNPVHRSKAIQFLNTEKVTKLLAKEVVTSQDAPALMEIRDAAQRLAAICAQQFPKNAPNLATLSQAINDRLQAANIKQQTANNKLQTASEEQQIANNKQQIAINDQQPTTNDQQPASTPAEPEIEIPKEVADLLQPISAQSPTGKELAQSTEVDYFNLQTEIRKVKPKYDVCIDLAMDLLKSKTKDVDAILWLSFAWYGKERIPGLKNGLLLLWQAFQEFGDKLYPSDQLQRGKAFNFLNRKQLGKMLAREKIDTQNAKEAVALQQIFQALLHEYEKQFSEKHRPSLKEIGDAIAEHAKAAEEVLKPPPPKPPAASPSAGASTSPASGATKSSTTTAGTMGTGLVINSPNDALLGLKRSLLFFFEEEKDGQKNRKAPDEASIYGLSRQLRWGKLGLPEIKEKEEGKIASQVEGPTPEKQAAIKNWLANNEWDKLIPDIEIKFLNDDGFRYWLEAQRYVVQALEQKGGKWNQSAQEVKFQLARLIQRLPDLTKLVFKDKKTPFASKETIAWLEDEVRGVLGAGRAADKILPPIMGEEYEPINKEFEAACAELPENFEKHADSMQKGMASEERRKGRFLRALNLANFCHAARKPELAKAMLLDLTKKIDEYQLAEWEPALCLAVWQSTYLTNLKLLQSENHEDEKPVLQRQQAELFAKISKHDVLRALELAQRQAWPLAGC